MDDNRSFAPTAGVRTAPWRRPAANIRRMILRSHHRVSHEQVADYLGRVRLPGQPPVAEANLFVRLVVASLGIKAATYNDLTAGATQRIKISFVSC